MGGTFQTRNGNLQRHLQSIVWPIRAAFKILDCLFAGLVLEGLVIDASVHDVPGESIAPKAFLSIANAVTQIVSGIEHEGVPDHQDI